MSQSKLPPSDSPSPSADASVRSSTFSEKPAADARLRIELTAINERLVALCNERAELLARTGSLGALRRLLRDVPPPGTAASGRLGVTDLWPVFRELDSATLNLIRRERVGYLGPEYSYSHLAAIAHFGQGAELLPIASIGGVFEAVIRGDAAYGIVPIENSTDGRIVDTLDMFVKLPVKICGEIPTPIHHNLLGIGTLNEIVEVQSKPQALSQCRNWLAKHLPKARLVPSTSTTAAAEAAAQDATIAAVASRQAGVNYGLGVLAENIEDSPDNVTRFAVIGLHSAARTGRDKTSLMFELAHAPGALADALNIFKQHRLNMTWIESFPKKGSQNEYLFFVELEGHADDAPVRSAIEQLALSVVKVELLGSYPRANAAK